LRGTPRDPKQGEAVAHSIRALVVAGCPAFVACGTDVRVKDVSGAWSGSNLHTLGTAFTYVQLVLQQDGAIITGKACESEDGFLIYSGVSVTGSYPDVAFTVGASNTQPCCKVAGLTFRGSFNGSGTTLTGFFNGANGPGEDWTLTRASDGSCAGALPVPCTCP
jgi:hypothetical protein